MRGNDTVAIKSPGCRKGKTNLAGAGQKDLSYAYMYAYADTLAGQHPEAYFFRWTNRPSCNTRYFGNERLHVSRCSQAPRICKLDTLIKPGLGEIYVAFCFVLDYGEELVRGYAKMYFVEI